jgi:hypothetical protein
MLIVHLWSPLAMAVSETKNAPVITAGSDGFCGTQQKSQDARFPNRSASVLTEPVVGPIMFLEYLRRIELPRIRNRSLGEGVPCISLIRHRTTNRPGRRAHFISFCPMLFSVRFPYGHRGTLLSH